MLTRPDRLRSSRDIRRVLRGGSRHSTTRCTAHLLPGPGASGGRDTSSSRVAVIASRRVGNAPQRNRAKRLLREAAAHVRWPDGAEIVLVARPDITGASLWDVLADLERLNERHRG